MRMSSITDQIYIKAMRIRSIEEKKEKKVNESVDDEYRGILNYCVIALIQEEYKNILPSLEEDTEENVLKEFDEKIFLARALMQNKNHDYGEVWRTMRVSSITDIILMRIHRIKQIEDNAGQTKISEGIASNYLDLINYCTFALIRLSEKK